MRRPWKRGPDRVPQCLRDTGYSGLSMAVALANDLTSARGVARLNRPTPSPTPGGWAGPEFGEAHPDARLQTRPPSLAHGFYARTTASLTYTCGSRVTTKAAYRFLDHARPPDLVAAP